MAGPRGPLAAASQGAGHSSDPAARRRALILLAVLTIIWGTNWPLFPMAVREVSVWTFRAFAMPASGLILLAVAAFLGKPITIAREHWGTLLAASVFYLVIWNISSTYAAVLLPSGQAAVLGYTMPLWAALMSAVLLGERLGPRLLVALALGAAAVTLLMVPSFSAYAHAPLGLMHGLLSGFGWALGTVILKRRPIPTSTMALTGWQMLVASVPVVIGALWFGQGPWFVPSTASLVVIVYIVLVPICIGNVCWFAIVGLLPASVAGLSAIPVVLVALISGAIVHGEPLGPLQWLAMACCAGSLWLALRPVRARPLQRTE